MMRRRPRKTIVVLSGLIALLVLTFGVYNWRTFAVAYHLHRMQGEPGYWLEAAERPDGTVLKEAAWRFLRRDEAFLGVLADLKSRSKDSKPPPDDPPRVRAFRAMGEMGLKAETPVRGEIVRQSMQGLKEESTEREGLEATKRSGDPENSELRRELEQIEEAAADALLKIGLQAEEAVSLYADALKAKSRPLRQAASLVLVSSDAGKRLIRQALSGIPPEHVVDFFKAILPDRWILPKDPLPDRPTALEIAGTLAREDGSPTVRAIALSFAVFRERKENAGGGVAFDYDFDVLREVFERNTHPIVRRAALRIAGALGQGGGNLDLKDYLLRERDPSLLREAVEARNVWISRTGSIDGFQLGEGILCDWIPQRSGASSDWDLEEIERLEGILREEKEGGLSDAVSLALAARYRDSQRYRAGEDRKAPLVRRMADLKVHEWGVWLDSGGTLKPSGKVLAELPPFVHRSELRADELWAHRSYHPMIITKPVVFFYSPKPFALFLQVGFFEGRPWTFFPSATD